LIVGDEDAVMPWAFRMSRTSSASRYAIDVQMEVRDILKAQGITAILVNPRSKRGFRDCR